jgi:signal transduction histidine kinase
VRSLYLRIFLSFWLAMGLIIAASVGITTSFVLSRTAAVQVELQRLDVNVLAQSAEKRLAAEGLEGLEQWISETRRAHVGLDIFVVDASGQQIFKGKQMPAFLVERMRSMVRNGYMNGPAKTRAPGNDPSRSAPQITAPNGAVYTMFFPPVRDPSLAILGAPSLQFLLLSIALIVSGVICWYLARSVTRPVERLQASARALAGGNLNARVGAEFASRRDELSVLAHDFDQMAERLRDLIASKEILLRDISHELRTPLARLRLALGLARRDGANLNREHDRIEREAERLDELIGQILQLARLNATQPELHCQDFDYANLVSDVVEDARLEATAQNKQVDWQYTAALNIRADQELLHSAIENVVRNAVRFTAVGTAVELSVQQQTDKTVLTIRDHGPGVPEDELAHLFEPFYRITQQARERDTGGYGLGLAITSRVIKAHNGQVTARNAPDGGLIVTLSVPNESSSAATKT